ncbi:MAG: 50S ribosomal protein L22 [Desulfobacterales bacterium]|nr:50S ribosomal protein L22 [Desulfobacterales bacterium]
MEVKAVSKYNRISPKKVRKIIDSLIGLSVETGANKLSFMPQKAAFMVKKVLLSAIANANTHPKMEVDDDKLIIKNIFVDQGPTLKRFRARARGRGTRILKRTSHITVVVG